MLFVVDAVLTCRTIDRFSPLNAIIKHSIASTKITYIDSLKNIDDTGKNLCYI